MDRTVALLGAARAPPAVRGAGARRASSRSPRAAAPPSTPTCPGRTSTSPSCRPDPGWRPSWGAPSPRCTTPTRRLRGGRAAGLRRRRLPHPAARRARPGGRDRPRADRAAHPVGDRPRGRHAVALRAHPDARRPHRRPGARGVHRRRRRLHRQDPRDDRLGGRQGGRPRRRLRRARRRRPAPRRSRPCSRPTRTPGSSGPTPTSSCGPGSSAELRACSRAHGGRWHRRRPAPSRCSRPSCAGSTTRCTPRRSPTTTAAPRWRRSAPDPARPPSARRRRRGRGRRRGDVRQDRAPAARGRSRETRHEATAEATGEPSRGGRHVGRDADESGPSRPPDARERCRGATAATCRLAQRGRARRRPADVDWRAPAEPIEGPTTPVPSSSPDSPADLQPGSGPGLARAPTPGADRSVRDDPSDLREPRRVGSSGQTVSPGARVEERRVDLPVLEAARSRAKATPVGRELERTRRAPSSPLGRPPVFQSTIVKPPSARRKTASMRPRTAMPSMTVSTAISISAGVRWAHSLARKRSFIAGSSASSPGSSSALPGRSRTSTIAAWA